MHALTHRIKVFVFSKRGDGPQYLMVRHAPKLETFWGPVEGEIRPSENLELAVCRRVRDEVGFERPLALVDLKMPERWVLPDEQVVEWIYGYGVEPGAELPRHRGAVREARWESFDHAFRAMELPGNRDAILRLHLTLTE